MPRFPRRELGLALVCCGLLMMEICLTKIFSVVLWYHFGFLAVSTALLGFASAGVYLSLRPRVAGSGADRAVTRYAAMAAVTAVASLWLVTQTTFDVYTLVQDRTVGTLLAFVLWVTLPFFFLGLVISLTLAAFPQRVNTLYGADLIGSAFGCGLAVLILNQDVSGQEAILYAAVLIGSGGALFAGAHLPSQAVAAAGLAAPVMVLALSEPMTTFPLHSPPSKPYHMVESFDEEMARRGQTWVRGTLTLTSGDRLEIESPWPPQTDADGGVLTVYTDDGPRQLALGDVASRPEGGLAFEPAPWSTFRRWTSLSRVDAFHWPQPYGAWGLWGLSRTFSEQQRPLPRQKGITIDTWAMTSIMRYSGRPLQPIGDPAVDAERRKLQVLEYLPAGTVHRIVKDIDHIVCIGAGGGLDLLTAKYFGARRITGVEINPGVVDSVREAFPEFAGHLYDPKHHPEIRVHVAEGRHFLESSHEKFDVIQLSGVDTFSTTEAGAFSLSENYLYTVEAFETFLRHLDREGVLTLTRWFYPSLDDGQLHLRGSLRLLALARQALERHIRPEDSPEAVPAEPGRCIFFLKSENFTVILVKPDGFSDEEVRVLREHCSKYRFEPLWDPGRATPEISVLGQSYANPLQAYMQADDPDAWLAAQKFDVTPPVDDRPFFFEFSRFARVFDRDQLLNPLGGLTAHGLLMLLLGEVVLLGLVFVILPLVRLAGGARTRTARRARAGVLVYFTAIGFGFIAVEIVLSQKFVLFLGHPFYALSVILFSVLLFSGIGALVSRRFPMPKYATLLAALLALVPALLFQTVFENCLSEPLHVRIALSVTLLAPVGLAMGIPFPAGIAALRRIDPGLIPWAWGINGYTSVLGSVLAVMLGIELGFMAVLCIAALVYATGVVGYTLMQRGGDRGVRVLSLEDVPEPWMAGDGEVPERH